MSSTDVSSVLVIDDHEVFREGVTAVLLAEPRFRLLGTCASAEAGFAFAIEQKPDIILLDLRLPDEDGLDVLSRLRVVLPATRVLVLSSHDSAHMVRRALELGATGYVSKQSGAKALLQGLRWAVSGRRYLSPEIAENLAETVGERGLSTREVQVLRLAAQGLGNAEIAKALGISVRTVKFHFNGIMVKLEASDRTHAVANAVRRGILDL